MPGDSASSAQSSPMPSAARMRRAVEILGNEVEFAERHPAHSRWVHRHRVRYSKTQERPTHTIP